MIKRTHLLLGVGVSWSLLITSVLNCTAQGVIQFTTSYAGGPRATNALTGAYLQLGANTNVTGVQFLAQLYWAAGFNQSPESMTALTNPPATFGTNSTFAGYISAGSGGGNRIISYTGPATVQIRVWSFNGGHTTYEAASAAAFGGDSSILLGNSSLMDYPVLFQGSTPSIMVGPNFGVGPIPEPSTWALFALGGACLSLFARRRRK
jgi:hypothetical protein